MANGESFNTTPALVISAQEAAQLRGATERLKTSEAPSETSENEPSALSPIHTRVRTAVIAALGAEWQVYRTHLTAGQRTPQTANLDTIFAQLQEYFHEEGTYTIEGVNERTSTMCVKISLPPAAREHPNFVVLMNVVKYASLLLNRLAQARGRITILEGDCARLRSDIREFRGSIEGWRQQIKNGAGRERTRELTSAIEGTGNNITRMEAAQTEKEEILQRAKNRLAQYERIIAKALVLPNTPHNESQSATITDIDMGAFAQKLQAAVQDMKNRGDISNEHLEQNMTPDFTITVPIEIEPEVRHIGPSSLQSSTHRDRDTTGENRRRKKQGNSMRISLSALALLGLIASAMTLARKSDTTASAPNVTTSSWIPNAMASNGEKSENEDGEPWMNEDQMHRAGRQMFDKFQQQHGGLNFQLEMKDNPNAKDRTEKTIILTVKTPDTLKGMTSHGELITVTIRSGDITVRTEAGKKAATFDPTFNGIIISQLLESPDAMIRVPYTVSVEGHGSVQDEAVTPMSDIVNAGIMMTRREKQNK